MTRVNFLKYGLQYFQNLVYCLHEPHVRVPVVGVELLHVRQEERDRDHGLGHKVQQDTGQRTPEPHFHPTRWEGVLDQRCGPAIQTSSATITLFIHTCGTRQLRR